MTDETEVEETEAAAEEHPEPVPVGHQVVQDNVTEPGVQHTHTPDGEGGVQTSSHNDEEAAAEGGQTPAEDAGEVPLDGAAAKVEAERQGLLDKGEDGDEEPDDEQADGAAGEGEDDAKDDAEEE